MLQQNLIISLPTYPKFCWYATGTTHIFHLGLIVSPLPLVGAHTKICPKYWKSTSVAANNDLLTKNSSKTHMLTQWHHSFMNDCSDCSIVGKMHEEKPVSPLADGQLTITVSHMIYLMMWLTDSRLQIYSTKKQGTRLTQMEAKGPKIHVFWNFVDLSGLYTFMFNYSHAFYFIYMCVICRKLIDYVEMKELWRNTYNFNCKQTVV